MSRKNYKEMAKQILPLVGGVSNIESFTNCMTRLRVTVKDSEKVSEEGLRNLSFVIQMQYIAGVYQIVLGPGVVDKVATEFGILTNIHGAVIDENLDDDLPESLGQRFLKLMQAVIMPSIGAVTAVALINGLLNVFKIAGVDITTVSYLQALSTFASVGISSLVVLFGFNLAKYLKGNVYLALLLTMFLVSPQIGNVTFMGNPLVPGTGGLVGALMIVFVMCKVERKLKKVIPDSLSLILVPLTTVLISMLALLFIIIPIATLITGVLVKAFEFVVNGNQIVFILGCIAIAAAWPFLVMSGLHMSLMIVTLPIFVATGYTPLIDAAFLGGAAQLGTAAAVFVKEKDTNEQVRETFLGGAPTAFLGVIEPLMYGINLPRVKPLIIASISAGIGGFFIGITKLTMTQGLSGIIGFLSFKTLRDMVLYVVIWLGTAIVGCILCSIFYTSKEE